MIWLFFWLIIILAYVVAGFAFYRVLMEEHCVADADTATGYSLIWIFVIAVFFSKRLFSAAFRYVRVGK